MNFVKQFRKYTTIKQPPYKILFFGSDCFSLVTLKKLHNAYINGSLITKLEVMCLPHSKIRKSVVHEFATNHQIPIYYWGNFEFGGEFDLGVVVSFGKMMPQRIIDSFSLGMLNVHGSLLPQLRGSSPVSRAIQGGITSTGVSIFQIKSDGFDHGKILSYSSPVVIDDHVNSDELTQKLAYIGADLCLEVLWNFPERIANAKEQDRKLISYAPKINVQETFINWESMTPETILKNFRAFGYQKDYFLRCEYNGQMIKFLQLSSCTVEQTAFVSGNCPPGMVSYHKPSKTLLVKCCSGHVACTKLLYGKILSSADFYNGFWQKVKKQGKNVQFLSNKY
uniref:Methionyl-tRNA formyltransferase, mitochondrial n=1 Tax=Ciona intestinalis TaxID=7719 RepID=F6PWH7_CIOIN|nr:methionyl-tRNA formyltransferase, mitochondrial [Ciona intestinalis]|eukprot:XP_002129780.1 methionyl-tRNA formyltransferase, mitochondrial [Ciona intestinalis]